MRITVNPSTTTQLRTDTTVVLDLSALFEGADPETATITGFELLDSAGDIIVLDHRLRVVIDPTLLTVTLIPEDIWQDQSLTDVLANVASLRYANAFGMLTLPAAVDFDPPYTSTVDGEDTDDRLATVAFDTTPQLPVRMNGYQGNDRLTVTGLAGVLFGGEGADTLRGGAFDDALSGDTGNDALYGIEGIDRLVGGEGNDRLFGGAGLDHLDGGDGDDLLHGGSGDDILVNGGGNDTLRGEAGNDRIELSTIARSLEGTIFTATTLAYGGDGNDTFAMVGNTVMGGQGNATSGDVTLHGGAGDDTVFATELDSAAIYGGAGNDDLRAYMNIHTTDTARIYGGGGDDTIRGSTGLEAFGGNGNDDILVGNGGAARGDAGDDVLTVEGDETQGGGATGGTLFGGAGLDVLNGGDQSDTMRGGDGNDTLYGQSGIDVLFGGSGNDLLYGGRLDDLLNGGDGDNQLTGGAGFDTFVFASTTGHSQIRDFAVAESLAFDASALNLGNGDEVIEDIAVITTFLDLWNSSDEVVFLNMALNGAAIETETVNTLNLHLGAENLGDTQLIVANDGINTYIMRHVADGVLGVNENDLTLIGTLEGYTGNIAAEMFFF